MRAATRAFTATCDDQQVRITPDTRVCVGHPIALAHASAFAPLIGTGVNARIDPSHTAATTGARGAMTTTASRRNTEPLYVPKERATGAAVAARTPPDPGRAA